MINETLARTAFNNAGLDAMGSASAQLSALWGDTSPTHNDATMSLQIDAPSTWRAPIGGVVVWSASGAPDLTDHAGAALAGEVAVLRFDPQAALRLRRLTAARYSADGVTNNRPTPFAAAIVGGTAPAELADVEEGKTLPPDFVSAGDTITHGTLTFHDERGLIIDPVAVACLMRDLMLGLPALRRDGVGILTDVTTGGPGSIASVVALATTDAVRLHLVDLFGRPRVDVAARDGVRFGAGARLDAGPHDWTTAISTTNTTGPLRMALLPDATLATANVSPPSLPTVGVPAPSSRPNLERQFFRIVVADTALHLTGNRSDSVVEGVRAADVPTQTEPDPPIGSGDIELLPNGQRFLGAISEVAALTGTRLAVSPTIADDFVAPTTRTDAWPAVPAAVGTPQDLTGEHSSRARTEGTAAFVGSTVDVVVTWLAGALPVESFVRVFPRVDPGPAIVPLEELGFSRRGDGGAGIVAAGSAFSVVVLDPFRVGTGSRPTDPTLIFDLLIVTRGPAGVNGRLLGSLEITGLIDGGVAPTVVPVTNALTGIADNRRGISPAPVLGLTQTALPDATDPVLAALGEAAPRESPRFATMARTESIVAGHDDGSPGTWTSVLGPGFVNARSLTGDARLGSPGLPAGPEDHAPAIRANGALAQGLARAALRRTHHLSVRLAELDDGRWTPPSGAAGGATGAVLQSIPPTVEAPELRVVPQSVVEALPDDWAGLITALSTLLPSSLSGLASSIPTPGAGDRWVEEVKREAMATHHGRRDTQWALLWALSHARRIVYLETALLSATGHGTDAHVVDLVQTLVDQLGAEPDLRVVLVVPRRVPFGRAYESFAQRMYLRRVAAVEALRAAAEDRVIVYHPVGFPGRPENLRGSLVVVDDVWGLVGGSTFSRRGLTFDGSTDVAFVGHDLREGVSQTVRELRRNAMARVLGVAPRPAGSGQTADPRWVRLADPRGSFSLMQQMLANGGEGEIQRLWDGLPEAELPALSRTFADPEGKDFPTGVGTLAAEIAGLGADRF